MAAENIRCGSELLSICSKRPTEALRGKGASSEEAPETEAFLQHAGAPRGPLLRAMWQVFRSTFLLGTISLVVGDIFRFALPKLLR